MKLASIVVLFTFALAAPSFSQTPPATTPSGPWDITVDVGSKTSLPSVNPARPVARIGDDDYLSIQILIDGKIPAREDKVRLRFAQPVLKVDVVDTSGFATLSRRDGSGNVQDEFAELGSAHTIRFRKCNGNYLARFVLNGKKVTDQNCPFIVSNGAGNVTVYANTDSIALDAEVDNGDDGSPPFEAKATKHALFTIRTVRPWWNLNFSTGFSFFTGKKVRDAQYSLQKIDGSTDQRIVANGYGETPYEAGVFATYMLHRPFNIPMGLTFGVSTKIPVDQLTAGAGLSFRIEPFPITNSAYLTTGIAYRAHKALQQKYSSTLQAPAGVTETDLVESRHDIGFFIAFSFGFGGGEDQFKKVVSGQ